MQTDAAVGESRLNAVTEAGSGVAASTASNSTSCFADSATTRAPLRFASVSILLRIAADDAEMATQICGSGASGTVLRETSDIKAACMCLIG